jgi:hypothetical protein
MAAIAILKVIFLIIFLMVWPTGLYNICFLWFIGLKNSCMMSILWYDLILTLKSKMAAVDTMKLTQRWITSELFVRYAQNFNPSFNSWLANTGKWNFCKSKMATDTNVDQTGSSYFTTMQLNLFKKFQHWNQCFLGRRSRNVTSCTVWYTPSKLKFLNFEKFKIQDGRRCHIEIYNNKN